MNETYKISIVTPSYNQGQFLTECLESVQSQEGTAVVEHIVIDGQSRDESVDLLRRYSNKPEFDHLTWISESDAGQSEALNKGFRRATGDIVGWLNSDDRYRPGCFESVIQAFKDYPDVDILYGDYTWIDEGGRLLQVRREMEFSHFVLSYHRVLYIPTTATFFRRRVFDEGNFIGVQYHYAMDYEYFLRLSHRGYRFKHIPCLLADFRWHADNKSGAHSEEQLAEGTAIAKKYSQVLSAIKRDRYKALMFSALRCAAAVRRYSEKLVRGYYWQRSPASITSRDSKHARQES